MSAQEIQIAKDDYLIREGEESSHMFYLQKGSLAVFKKKGGGEMVQIGTIYSGEVVGEMSFLDKEPRSATVKAVTDCVLMEIPSEQYEKLFKSLPNWYKALVRTLLDRLRKANARVRI